MARVDSSGAGGRREVTKCREGGSQRLRKRMKNLSV